MLTREIGFYPNHLELDNGPVTVRTLSDLQEFTEWVRDSPQVEKDWFYAPPQKFRNFSDREIHQQPYSARVFALPKTHSITHTNPTNEDHLTFHIWSLSFFTGMRLSATEAGFLDATPIKKGKLVDFVIAGDALAKSIALAEQFWSVNAQNPRQPQRFAAAVHALFLAHNPQMLQFERFLLLYTALDACYAIAKIVHPPPGQIRHAERTEWMCQLFGIPVPDWAKSTAKKGAEVARIRNDTIHEAIYMDEPLGFALHGIGTNQNLPLQMEALICRLLVALIGGASCDYVRSRTDSRQKQALILP